MNTVRAGLTLFVSTAAIVTGAGAQQTPTVQPAFITIVREDVKVGHATEHQKTEAGWPAAFARAKSPTSYLALVSLTGPAEAWYVAAYPSQTAYGEDVKRQASDPVLSAELNRLSMADAAHLNNVRTVHALARTDLSHGPFPDLAFMRFFEVTIFRVRPGFETDFDAVAKGYAAAATKAVPDATWRVYEVAAGLAGPTYLIFSSLKDFGEFDKALSDGQKMMAAMAPTDIQAYQKFAKEGMINVETFRFSVDPVQSYVSAEVRAKDPAFWLPKKPAAKAAGGQP